MTFFVPLEASSPLPQTPSFLVSPNEPTAQLSRVIKSILKAKRIVVVSGAGISVQAGIPDFRSPEGLFKTLKRDNPREGLASGRDLFDASVFNSEQSTSLFCQMIAQLSELSEVAEPTAFHQLLRALDNRGKLLRVYTQNIDALEQKCGLSFGVPGFEDKRFKIRSKGKPLSTAEDPGFFSHDLPIFSQGSTSRLPSPPVETPRCIPLHGTLQMLHCQICTHSFPLQDYLPSLSMGQPPTCPECTSLEKTRQLVGKRARGIGKLRPSVVLYNEAHKDGEGVGEVVRKDLIGSSKGKGRSGADLLLVVGTSLRVPGTKRMVREFSKAVRSRGLNKDGMLTTGLPSPAPSPRRSPATDEEPSMKAVYLNLDFPVPMREWEGVFDVWVQGDAQQFAEMLQQEINRETRVKELANERRRKREAEIALAAQREREVEEKAAKARRMKKTKRKGLSEPLDRPNKRQRTTVPLTPPKTPVKKASSGTSPSPRYRKSDTESTKLMLRIPARPRKSFLVPEVYITTTPPHSTLGQKFTFSQGQPPPTPDKSPPPAPRPNLATKAGRRAARLARLSSARVRVRAAVIQPGVGTSVDDDEAELLPNSFVRTVQYGLRGSGG